MFRIYVALALVGSIFPYVILIPWLADHGLSPGVFGRELFATRPATIFATDVLYASGVFFLFLIVEGRRLAMQRLWLPPLLTLVFGLCCGLPAFLAMRERALAGSDR
jgi:hypothetical protein